MAIPRPSFTVGIEEEYMLVDLESRDLVKDPPPSMMAECKELLQGQVSPEFLRGQIEVGTQVSRTVGEARRDLARLRRVVSDVALRHGMAPIAASTHPFARWGELLVTDKTRYRLLLRELETVVRRLVISGMHVHIGIDDNDLRIDLMNQFSYFLPHLLALSTSSPFWHGGDTGLKSYRSSVFKSLPRTGIPVNFTSWGEYQRHVDVLVDAGLIEDATKLWWDIRPSARYPTLEMRATDICTRLDDGVALAALTVSLMHMLYRLRSENKRWRIYARMLLEENMWRAQRYGIHAPLMDFGQGALVPIPDLVDEVIEMVQEDAQSLGCWDEVLGLREILVRGTSADRQVATYEAALAQGAEESEALQAVVDFLIRETVTSL
ncbi:carboxylate-amine ligase YbdK [bacterium BMS3Abin02]|nr:carboxylate-amine ligase YbdK [bacterium BMS3Abin02]GBE21726.1 carboxylate-amine ligase YbdK [bacterium BMS3Bbin01]HDL49151.1 carboxylate-amine ligase [Actinomycetota bacterium]